MKIRLALCAVVIASVAASAHAGVVRITGNSYQYGEGGEFTITPISGMNGITGQARDLSANSFQTFCVEYSEHINLGSTYYTQLATSSSRGGVGGGSPDPLSPATAYLYTQFRMGTLSNYDASGTARRNDARSLQLAIWFLEDEINPTTPLVQDAWSQYMSNTSIGIQARAWVTQAQNATAFSNSIGQVRVLRMFRDAGLTQYSQDQLTLVPLPPAAYTGLATLAGLAGFRAWRRRR